MWVVERGKELVLSRRARDWSSQRLLECRQLVCNFDDLLTGRVIICGWEKMLQCFIAEKMGCIAYAPANSSSLALAKESQSFWIQRKVSQEPC